MGQDVEQMMREMLRKQIPALKCQAQYNTYRAAVDAFHATINGIFSGIPEHETNAKKVLEDAFTACRQATELYFQLEQVPDAANSKTAEEFKKAPDEFREYDIQRKLLEDLATLNSLDGLKQWYQENRDRRDAIKSQTLRDVLMDAIRQRKIELSGHH